MKIVSRFRDYYDSVGRTDHEDRPLYVRQTSDPIEILGDAVLERAFRRARAVLGLMPGGYGVAELAVLGFCGRAYPLLLLTVPATEERGAKRHALYDLDAYERLLQQLVEARAGSRYDEALDELNRRPRGYSYALTRRSWTQFQHDAELDVGDEAFRALRAPAFLLRGARQHVVIANPCLQDFEFASQVDPYTAYQAIDVFLGNNLSDVQERVPELSDELKRDAHGYDDWSFKKRPKKKS